MVTFYSKSVILIIIAILASYVDGVDDKCAACNAIAEELELGLLKEKPRNHLDLRYRLDSKGQREGKLIDYRVSELRVVELLDGLCEKMQDYTLQKVNSGRKEWIKVNSWDNFDTNKKQEARAYSKDISTFCGRLLEETEDQAKSSPSFCKPFLLPTFYCMTTITFFDTFIPSQLSESIMKGSVQVGEVSKVFCHDLGRYCSKTSDIQGAEDDDETSDREL